MDVMRNKYSENSICRVCLSAQEENYMSLFDKYRSCLIFEYINIITNVNIVENEDFPNKICRPCFLELEAALRFKEKCEHSNILLQSQNIKVESADFKLVIKNEFDADVKIEKSNGLKLKKEIIYEDSESFSYDYEQPLDQDDNLTNLESDNNKSKKGLVPPVECHDCGNIFKSKCKLGVHWKKTHMQSQLICVRCKRIFKSYKAMHVHMKRKTKSCNVAASERVHIEGKGRLRLYHCKECNYQTVRLKDMESHLRTHSGERPYECDICPKKFTQQSSLQTHKEVTHKKITVEITCQFCGKLLRGRHNIYRHLRTHDEKMQCKICKKLIIKGYYKNHMKRHSGDKFFTCEICAARFYSSAELCNHKRFLHNGQAQKCPKCDYSVIKSCLLKKHISNHTDKNIPCTVCGRFFLTLQKLTTHQKMHFDKKTIPCPVCDRMFLYRDSMRKHLIQKHHTLSPDIKVKNSETVTLIKTSP